MSRNIPIFKKHADTGRIVFRLSSKEFPSGINLASWTAFELAIDPEEAPIDNSNNVALLSGTIIDAATGRVGFIPTGTVAVGNYFYNARGVDGNGERITFAHGTFEISQDI